ncbi:hypothetical protein [Streptomyces sirii]|uniref:hypothetical protein n=1 Tax=Streptomyces sirii TaxID=3127701 RepID=UPI003D36DCB4
MHDHDIEQIGVQQYYCEEHGVRVVLHAPGPSLEVPPRRQGDDPVYVITGRGTRYHGAESCYVLGRARPVPVVVVTSRAKAERDGKTACHACIPDP